MNKRQKKKTLIRLGQAIDEGRELTRSERKVLRKALQDIATRLRGEVTMTETEIMAAVGKLYSFLVPLVIMVVLFFEALEELE